MEERPLKAPRLCRKDEKANSVQPPESPTCNRNFTYQPLAEPLRQIRLLRFFSGARNHSISLEISTWLLANTPSYTAISYTWGPENTRDILVDGCAFNIRANCYNALRQVALHLQTGYFWIDSICIDQQHRSSSEKNAQVSIMYKIYRRAYQVLACIGEHDESSEHLFSMVGAIKPLLDAANTIITPWRTEKIWKSLFAALGPHGFRTIYNDLCVFEKKPFWKRLWILQELYAGQVYLPGTGHADLWFLCGDHAVSILLLRRFFIAVDEGLYGKSEVASHTDLPYLTTALMSLRYRCKPSFEKIFHSYGGTHLCSDPHDHLYGLVSMASTKGTAPLPVVDYGRSLLDVALDVTSLLEDSVQGFPTSHRKVLACFQLNAFSLEIETLVKRHSQALITKESLAQARRLNMSLGKHQRCARLSAGPDGTLAAEFHASGFDTSWVEWEQATAEALLQDPSFQSPKTVMSGADTAAIVCNTARSGDLIMLLGIYPEDWPWLLVLRQSSHESTVHDIVGQGYCVNSYVPGRPGLPAECHCDNTERAKHETFYADFNIRLTAEEALALTAQDFVRLSPEETNILSEWSAEETSWDADKRFERLSLLPVSSPTGAVEVNMKECFALSSHNKEGWSARASIAVEGNSIISIVLEEDDLHGHQTLDHERDDPNTGRHGQFTTTTSNVKRVDYVEDSDLFSISTSDSDDDFWNTTEFKSLPMGERYRRWQVIKYNM